MSTHDNLLGGPPPTRLPEQPELTVAGALDDGADPADLAARYPASSLPWAVLAERALDAGRAVEGYAYARTGYHRGLDALRRGGWRGHGPVPWDHVPNRGFLRALRALGRAAEAIQERDEAERCATFLRDCDPAAAAALA
ncbi:MAG TPA: DUF3151 domain-containing protein [Actinomycetales bacterium]|nr:DUF3151 domain-containing protein [Actinomycetales bacterium]